MGRQENGRGREQNRGLRPNRQRGTTRNLPMSRPFRIRAIESWAGIKTATGNRP
ncbi:hypothetical protein [Sphingobacterium prati]|uniref:hypothetical protein n=1 Tax=Sphingobacterium prati TaxID=2737006 RepID=UPI0015569025|nr:hypothetical protein [Sphingobacterium prati]NPE48545.1 hypothetical protein [Sphingobacterium prati]